MKDRTVILVSHHVQLCAPGAKYIVALDNGRLQFQGNQADFMTSKVLQSLSQSGAIDKEEEVEEGKVPDVEDLAPQETPSQDSSKDKSETNSSSTPTATDAQANAGESETKPEQKKAPRKLVEEEKRAVGRIGKDIWTTYLQACGGVGYWLAFSTSLLVAAAAPVLQNWWLKYVLVRFFMNRVRVTDVGVLSEFGQALLQIFNMPNQQRIIWLSMPELTSLVRSTLIVRLRLVETLTRFDLVDIPVVRPL